MDLYQDIILEHNKRPHHFGVLADATHRADGHNPMCGDEVEVFLKVVEDRVVDVTFQGEGCAISKASASIMTDTLRGLRLPEVQAKLTEVHGILTGSGEVPGLDEVGELAALAGVRRFPARIKCATLAWHAVDAALKGKAETSTELEA